MRFVTALAFLAATAAALPTEGQGGELNNIEVIHLAPFLQ
jgi:hypothetical protein